MHGWKRWLVVGIVAALVVVVGGPFIYFHFIQGPAAPPLAISDTVPTDASATPTTAITNLDGTWKVASGSQVGYRVKETLFGQSATAVGRTTAVTGQFVLGGSAVSTASFSVDMTKVSSDRSQRDDQFHGRIMDTADFPTATFTITSPIDLGTVPASGIKITPKATGKLTLHGTTKTVTVSLTAERTGNVIQVSGSVPITFSEYNIDNPSGGPASVGNAGTPPRARRRECASRSAAPDTGRAEAGGVRHAPNQESARPPRYRQTKLP
jgi:polyisoprenoid-binding protein YceI